MYHRNATVLSRPRPAFRDHPCEPVPEDNVWTLWCKGRLTEADTPTIRLGATPSRLTSAHLNHPPFFIGRMPFLPPNQQCQSTEGTDVCTCAIIIDSGGSGVKEGVVRQGVWEMEGLCPLGVQGQSPPV